MNLHIPNKLDLSSMTHWLTHLPKDTKLSLIQEAEFSSIVPVTDNCGVSTYGRKVIYQDSRIEILLTGWRSLDRCLPHDHAQSVGIVLVLSGHLANKIYDPTTLKPTKLWTVSRGKVFVIPTGTIHSVLNCNNVKAIGLHVYWPPINCMAVYDPEAGKKWQVKGTAGAWRPEKDDIINETNLEVSQ